jgi:hypothetical protein
MLWRSPEVTKREPGTAPPPGVSGWRIEVESGYVEPRLLVAYGLIATLLVVTGVAALVYGRRRAARRRRLRGIKDYSRS